MAHTSLQNISILFKLTTRRINQYHKDPPAGMPPFPRIDRGQYDIMACTHWIIDYYRREIERLSSGGESMREAELREKKARASMLEMTLAERRGQILSVDEAVYQVQPVTKAIRERILAIPRKAAPQLQSRETIAEKEELLKQLCNETLNDLSALQIRARSHSESPEAGDTEDALDAQAAAAAHRKRVGGRKKKTQSGK